MVIKTERGDLPIRYSRTAIARFADMLGISMDDMNELDLLNLSEYKIYSFIYVGFLYGAKEYGVKCKVKDSDDVGFMLEKEPEIVSKVIEAFASMMPEPKVKEEDKKK